MGRPHEGAVLEHVRLAAIALKVEVRDVLRGRSRGRSDAQHEHGTIKTTEKTSPAIRRARDFLSLVALNPTVRNESVILGGASPTHLATLYRICRARLAIMPCAVHKSAASRFASWTPLPIGHLAGLECREAVGRCPRIGVRADHEFEIVTLHCFSFCYRP